MPLNQKPSLAKKIAGLKMTLAPLVPMPSGEAHPAFPSTLLAYHLLTEDELDSIAHYYHQSTPGIWTHQYPACMNWDKEQLRRASGTQGRRQSQAQLQEEADWWSQLIAPSVTQDTAAASPKTRRRSSSARPSRGLSDVERIAIKRRKVGKFIGLIGMDTPIEEVEGIIRRSMERAIHLAREELRKAEEWELRRKKMV
ncbi:hypothetical protein MBLNU459_g5155t1 [Dothideomycetes sp. NU459]